MTIGVDYIKDPALRAKLQEMDSDRFEIRQAVSQIVQNVTLNVTGSNFTVIKRPDEPPHPSGNDTVIWRQDRTGQADVFYLSAKSSTGAKIWLWIGEAG